MVVRWHGGRARVAQLQQESLHRARPAGAWVARALLEAMEAEVLLALLLMPLLLRVEHGDLRRASTSSDAGPCFEMV